MGVAWGGPSDTGMTYTGFEGLRSGVVLAALWAVSEPGDYESLTRLSPHDRDQLLPEDDPVRRFHEMPEIGTLTQPQVAALASRLADIAYQLSVARRAHDNCAHSVFWLLRECAVAAARGEPISWS